MSNFPGVQQSLDQLRRLQRLITDSAAREQQLQQQFQARTAAETKRFAVALEREKARLAAARGETEALFQQRRAALEAAAERRRAAIAKAYRVSQKQVKDRIDLEEGRRKYSAQKGLLETERQLQAGRAANDARLTELTTRLTDYQEAGRLWTRAAQRALHGFRGLRNQLTAAVESEAVEPPHSPEDPCAAFEPLLAQAETTLRQLRRSPLRRVLGALPVSWLVAFLVAAHAAAVPAFRAFDVGPITYEQAAVSLGISLALVWALFGYARRQSKPYARQLATTLARVRQGVIHAQDQANARHQQEAARIEEAARIQTEAYHQAWDQAIAEAAARREAYPQQLEAKAQRIRERHARRCEEAIGRWQHAQAEALARLQRDFAAEERRLIELRDRTLAPLVAEREAALEALVVEWQEQVPPLYAALREAHAAAAQHFPAWHAPVWDQWSPPDQCLNAVKFGRVEVDLARLCPTLPREARLAWPGPIRFTLPLLLTFPRQGSLLVETTHTGRDAALAALNNVLLRLLALAPPGRLTVTLVDPVGLGQSFAGLMHLADDAEHLINRRIWTQTVEIEQRLAELNEHMEKVIQMYLRNEYPTLAEYNEQAGRIAEKYHFLVLADFPANFSEVAARRLYNLAASGARCGIYTLIHWDRRQPPPPDFLRDELRKNGVNLTSAGDLFLLAGSGSDAERIVVAFDPPPPAERATRLLRAVGAQHRDAHRVEVPFAQVAPAEGAWWTLDTAEEVVVPIGRTGATKLQRLALGKGTRQHALIAGKTGAGKSTLLHVLITNLSLWCSPEQVEFYLVDFKKGVEFKCYATHGLPHARVVAIESDREFGLSVLERVDEELRRRGDRFRALGAQDLASYRKSGETSSMPRLLLIIDEFQEFFVEEDRIAQHAAVLLDRIVRQGRAFGIHVLLGSQTLGGAYTLARSTMGQMVVRIALQCNEADAYLIMDENNAAPRLLSRPGEGIYNDAAGAIEGNSPFQTVWLPDAERQDWLGRLRRHAEARVPDAPRPFVFEGNAPADVRENLWLRAALQSVPERPPAAARFWLGAPNAIKGPTEVTLRRQSGQHLLLMGQREEASLAILSLGLVALAAQYPPGTARFILLDSAPTDSPAGAWWQRLGRVLSIALETVRGGELGPLLESLAGDLGQRQAQQDQAGAGGPAVFLLVQGWQHFKALRAEDEFSLMTAEGEAGARPAARLRALLTEGAPVGMHVLATCDTYNNAIRYIGRQALSEFGHRVLFQMSANDSASLIDNPKASQLGLHRALYFVEQEGRLETFRPYALPPGEWLDRVGAWLRHRAVGS